MWTRTVKIMLIFIYIFTFLLVIFVWCYFNFILNVAKNTDKELLVVISIRRQVGCLKKIYFYFQDTNEKIFFSLLSKNVEKYLPIVYTPTVGLACQRFGLIYRRPRGLFVTIYDKGHVLNILNNW